MTPRLEFGNQNGEVGCWSKDDIELGNGRTDDAYDNPALRETTWLQTLLVCLDRSKISSG